MIKQIVKNKVVKFIVIVWLLSLASGGMVQAQGPPLVIRDDATGGDCQLIGTWGPSTKVCTLTTNVNGTIQIDNDNLILDGNGYTITGSGSGQGVYLASRTGVTVRNLTIENFYDGILLDLSNSNTLIGNTISNSNHAGIYLQRSNSNELIENAASSTYGGSGIWLWLSRSNLVSDNTTSSNRDFGVFVDRYSDNNSLIGNNTSDDLIGIRLAYGSRGNTISNNTMLKHRAFGMDLWIQNDNNLIYNNNFIENNNLPQIRVEQSVNNEFQLSPPTGGNYWSDYDEPAEGCNDVAPLDGFCDMPYTFPGGQDNLPWTRQNGWLNQPPGTPVDTDPAANEVAEGVANGTSVGITASAGDPDDEPVTYNLTNDAGGRFAIDTVTGVVTVANGSLLDGPNSQTITVQASDDAGGISIANFEITVNNAPPTVYDITVDPEPSLKDGLATASASFSDPAGVNDGPFTCTVDYGDGSGSQPGTISDDTCTGPAYAYNAVGEYMVMVSAFDKDAGVGSNTTPHQVIYDFNGFFPPVDNPPALNSVKAGQAIPVKFSLNGDQGLDIFANGYPMSQPISCDTSGLTEDIEDTVQVDSKNFSYDAETDQYNYVWKTDKAWSDTCRQLVVKLNDNKEYVADFKFK
jgi:parallel beta-helix repeat protein